MFYDQEEMDNCSRLIVDKIISDRSSLDRFSSECQAEHDKLVQVAVDIESTKFGGLPDEIIFKVYDILLDQYTNLQKYSHICEAAIKEGKKREKDISPLSSGSDSQTKNLADMLVEMNRLDSQLQEAFSKTQVNTKNLFVEMSKRSGQKQETILLVTPEEMKYVISTGKVEDWEIQGRLMHYLMVYDLEKDDPLVYTLEKARVMELSLHLEQIKSEARA